MVSPIIKQSWIITGVLMNLHAQGFLLSYSSILLPSIVAPDSPLKVDVDTASWIASIIGISCVPAILAASVAMELYGRRIVHVVVAVPGIMGWICIYYANSDMLLLVGRALTGLASNGSLGSIIIGEYSNPQHRGLFLTLKTTAVCLGYLMIHSFGYLYHWRTVALIALIPHTASLLNTCTWPESPEWLASKQKYEKSEKTFYWLRGKNTRTINEIGEIIRTQREEMSANKRTLTFTEKVVDFCKKFTRIDFIKPVIIIFFSSVLLESSGRHIFPAFAVQIIQEVVNSDKTDIFYYNFGIDIVIIISAMFASVLIKLFNRRTILFTTGIGALFILYILCGYLYLVSVAVISNERPFIVIILFVIYFVLSNFGCTTIPLVLLGEIFPLAHRAAGSFVSSVILGLLLMVALKISPFLLANYKVYGTFSILGIPMGISLLVLWLMLPETKDKTLLEIENYLNYGRYNKDVDLDVSQQTEQYAIDDYQRRL